MENSEPKINIHPSSSSSLWPNCRPDVQRRINALLNYQAEYCRLRVEFHRQLQDLQYAFSPEFERILEEQRAIINGSYKSLELNKQISVEDNQEITKQSTIHRNGLENFWLTVLKNIDSYEFPIQSRDELCLKYLSDIRCILNPPDLDSSTFTLEFHFLPTNPFFTETVLTKQYIIRFQSNDFNPYRSYDGPEIDRCYGCSITWRPDHNLNLRKRTRRIRNKRTGQIRLVQIDEPVKTFFDFFSPPIVPENGIHEMTKEDQVRLEADIEFALFLKQRVLPRAVLYYTGEALPFLNEEDDNIDDTDESTSSKSS